MALSCVRPVAGLLLSAASASAADVGRHRAAVGGRVDADDHVNFSGPAGSWSLSFAAPGDAVPTPGLYEAATRWPFQSPTHPGLSVSGEGRGCNTLAGRFVVLEAVYDLSGTVLQFAADYEQHCEGGVPALFGSVRYSSAVTVEPRLSIAGASAYEGDFGTAAVTLVVSLSAPAVQPVGVQYHTQDGTATAGPDYVASSGSVVISPDRPRPRSPSTSSATAPSSPTRPSASSWRTRWGRRSPSPRRWQPS